MKIRTCIKSLFRSETIFYLGVFLLPFENFVFAPSTGWATFSPILFAIYLLFNFKHLWEAIKAFRKVVIFFIIGCIIGTITALIYQANFYNLINALIPMALGAISLLSFYIFYKKVHNLKTVVSLLVFSYSIAAVIGLFEFLSIKTENHAFQKLLSSLFKRDYLAINRVQFFFTEPSFIGMHLFGVLLPLFLLTKRKDLGFITAVITIESILFGSGMRVILDIFIVIALFVLYYIVKNKKYTILPIIIISSMVAFFGFYNSNPRFQRIVDEGIYSDGSFASRYFRVQSTAIGYVKGFPSVLLGYGLGNSVQPALEGYDIAEELYDARYTKEVEEVGGINYHEDNISFSLELRMINEFGLIMFVIAVCYLFRLARSSTFKYRYLYLAVTLYSYLQFESYAFYAIWLFIVIMHFSSRFCTNKELDPSLSRTAFQTPRNHIKPKNSPLRVLVFGMNDNPGGTESVIMNYYRHLDPKKVQLDFLCNTKKVAYSSEIEKLGGKIYHITARSKNRKQYKKDLRDFFHAHASEYDVIWENVNSLANIDYLIYAKRYGIPRRIIHSHNARNMDSFARGILHKLNRHRTISYATDFWACSEAAGEFFYPKDIRHSSTYKIINNAIDLKKFSYSDNSRKKTRKKLHVADEKVILNVGRLHFQKNQLFLLDIFAEIIKKDENCKLFLVGEGEDREKIEQKISDLNLTKKVTLLGVRDDVAELYQAADLVIFPSLFEGLGIIIPEAESAGLPLLVSDTITAAKELLTSHTRSLPLSDAGKWSTAALELLDESIDRNDYSKQAISHLTDQKYEISTAAQYLTQLLTEEGNDV